MSGVISSCIPLYIYISVTGAQADSVARGPDSPASSDVDAKYCVHSRATHDCLTELVYLRL